MNLGKRGRLLAIAAATAVFSGAVPLALAHDTRIHERLTQRAVDFLILKDKRFEFVAKYRAQLVDGSVAEDDLFPDSSILLRELGAEGRFYFHFLPALTVIGADCTSIDWGFGSRPCDTTVPPFSPPKTNEETWDSAKSRIGSSLEEAFRRLGNVLHLLQDVASPPHTRDDAHPHPVNSDPFETDEQILRRCGVVDGVADCMPSNTDAFIDLADEREYIRALRGETARRFYSADTVRSETEIFEVSSGCEAEAFNFQRCGPQGDRTRSDRDPDYIRDEDGRRIAYREYRIVEVGLPPVEGRLTTNEEIAREQFDVLAPRAVLYTASLIRHFIEKIDENGNGLPDVWEMLHWGNLSTARQADGDDDGDGFSNIEELRRGTDPLDPTSKPVPAGPSGLTATSASAAQINLSWQDNATTETGFRIERRMSTFGSFSLLSVVRASPGTGTVTFVDTGLSPITTYCYRVQAVEGVVTSGYSNEACATIPSVASWTLLTPTGTLPPGRAASSGVYASASNKLIVFGGHTGFTNLNDTWVLANANGINGTPTWALLNPEGSVPPGRAGHSAVYDATNKRMIIFGGNTGTNTFLNDVWVLANATGETGAPSWAELLPLGAAPSPRVLHTAVYDPTTNMMIVFGGGGPEGGHFELWVLENANGLGGTPNWIQLNPTGGPPQGRAEHTAVYNAAANQMLVFGGLFGQIYLNDFWILSNANGVGGTPTWSAPIVAGTPPALGLREHTAVYDSATDTMVVFGGELFTGCCAGATNRTWKLANASALGGTPTWKELAPSGSLPAPRVTAVGAYDQSSARMIIFGGGSFSPPVLLNDTLILVGAASN